MKFRLIIFSLVCVSCKDSEIQGFCGSKSKGSPRRCQVSSFFLCYWEGGQRSSGLLCLVLFVLNAKTYT